MIATSVLLRGGTVMETQEYVSIYYLLVPILSLGIVMMVLSMWQMRKACFRNKNKNNFGHQDKELSVQWPVSFRGGAI